MLRGAGLGPADRIFFPFSCGLFVGFWAGFEGSRALGALTIPGGGQDSPTRLEWMERLGVTALVCTPSYALHLLEEASVPSGPIYSVADMFEDEHFKARGLFEEVDVNGRRLKIPAMVPRLSATPGRTEWAGSEVGAFNAEIYQGLLGLTDGQLEDLRARGVI